MIKFYLQLFVFQHTDKYVVMVCGRSGTQALLFLVLLCGVRCDARAFFDALSSRRFLQVQYASPTGCRCRCEFKISTYIHIMHAVQPLHARPTVCVCVCVCVCVVVMMMMMMTMSCRSTNAWRTVCELKLATSFRARILR